MGSLSNGLFGGFNGRVGNLVGYMLNGKSIIRTVGHSGKALTLPRKANCEKMTVVNAFLRPNMNFIRSGFRLITEGTDRNFYNEAVSYNKKFAIQGEYPNISMDYTKALVSMGSLLKADTTTISKHENGIEFKWEVPADLPWRNRNDRAMLLIHFPDAGVSTYVLSGSRRHVGNEVVAIDNNLAESRMEAYISFIDEDAREISDSVHAGSLNVKSIETEDSYEETQEERAKYNTRTDKTPDTDKIAHIDSSGKFNKRDKNKTHQTRHNKKLYQKLSSSSHFSGHNGQNTFPAPS
ncbi:DUF6266 family protein [Pedobacter gandavensis]|uniref:DUF6266 family protein n=1 Tax=Pedobacter gandavensis TaxID=2679963 RepID=UPI0029319140|nr:DUF6266 family protein [Pedobacter gandavensis]